MSVHRVRHRWGAGGAGGAGVALIALAAVCVVPRATRVLEAQDRKSTRLNSSHGYISYAVFCLKKKTIWNLRTVSATRLLSYSSQDAIAGPASTVPPSSYVFFFFNDTATTEIYTLSLHDALPISFTG